ncbi:sulfatase family protein [Gottschalkia acidurici 9a]|uniref:Sulfatase family protein n=1 Tax=Gottschalkia acidurici (strain ATCC 7906 / DSM 604 / BCRC 14475 / CIP 104303 / KCTC 5404 / NCIMB 10678 / 9a) TaxID=1128398 RepID=K0B3B8_GOTA9|nr:LTA synthase family protein [Gottschalkia acidurici]AFS79924.1 sulfatase family protein [Gottschalkia acidurici 9a]
MYKLGKYKVSIIEILTILILFSIKVSLFSSLLENENISKIVVFLSLLYMVCIMSFVSLFNNKIKKILFTLSYALISIIMFMDVIYFKYFNQLPSIISMKQVLQLNAIKDSINYLISNKELLLLGDIIPICIYTIFKSNSGVHSYKKYSSCLTITLVIAIVIVTTFINTTSTSINLYMQEFFSYHVNDIYSSLLAKNDIKNIDMVFNNEEETSIEKRKYYGIAKDRDVITIQVESLQNFVINSHYEGQEITPNLNKLLKEDSIYYSNYYQQLGRGNTSDAEFVTHNSLYPAMDGQTYSKYYNNKYFGLPWILKDMGYSTIAFHGYDGSFWNRDKAYPYQGFDKFISQKDFEIKDHIGFGLADKDFFDQSMEHIKELKSPYYAFLVTLTSHHPYEIPDKYKTIKLNDKHKGTIFGNYIESIRYADEAIGEFIEDLKKEGLYDNAIINIYGDHFGLSSKDEEIKNIMTDYLGIKYDFDEMMNVPLIMHIPNSNISLNQDITGGQIDFLPTVLNLLGIENKKGIMIGRDLNNSSSGFVAQQTYMIKGSFIADDIIFEMSRDEIYSNSRAWNTKTKEKIDVEECRKWYEKAIKQINLSDYILRKNILEKSMVQIEE